MQRLLQLWLYRKILPNQTEQEEFLMEKGYFLILSPLLLYWRYRRLLNFVGGT
jgi:hypothetical protein